RALSALDPNVDNSAFRVSHSAFGCRRSASCPPHLRPSLSVDRGDPRAGERREAVGNIAPRRGDSASGANERRCYAPRADRGSAPRPPASGGRGGCARVKYLFPLTCVLAACGDSTSIPPTPPPPPPGTPMLQAVGTFFRPTYLTAPGSDSPRLFVTERGGAIRIVRNDTIVPTPFLDLRGKIDSAVESGLFSMAFHPQYATNHKFFVFFTNLNGDTRIVRYLGTANPDSADPNSA